MKYLALFYFFLTIFFSVYSQQFPQANNPGKITGRVIDSLSKQPIEYATVSAFPDGNTTPINGTLTNGKGIFSIVNLAPGNYKVIINFIGYKSFVRENININTNTQTINLGKIFLTNNAQTLQGITVTAPRNLIENKIDKLVYNVERDITSQGGVATDVLKKVPQVSVDVNGNVELQGNSNITFLIDGKPSSIFGNNITEALQSIPASQIKSIEVITNPGAKYDAEGTGGIINIVMKKNNARGINGNVTLSAGTRLENGSVNMNARKGTFGLNLSVRGNAQLSGTTINGLDRNSIDTAGNTKTRLIQNGNGTLKRNGYEAQIGFDWSITKKNNLTGSAGYDNFGNNTGSFTHEEQIIQSGASPGGILNDLLSRRSSSSQSRFPSMDWNIDYKKKFKKEDQELNILIESDNGKNNSYYIQQQVYASNDSVFSGSQNANNSKDREINIQADYTHPLSERVKFETGGRTVLRKISSNSDFYNLEPSSNDLVFDSSQSNRLKYNRNVYAAYVSMTFAVFKAYDIKLGERFERTETNADFITSLHTILPGYNTFVPSAVISRTFKNNQTIKISYSKRIQRPGFRVLNPFLNASDPKNISVGNPDLNPEIGQNIELAYNKSYEKGGSLNITTFYRGSDHDIQPYTIYYSSLLIGDSVYQNVAVNTFENIGLEQNLGFNFYGSIPVTSKLNLRSNISAFHRHIINALDPGNNINSFNYRVNLNVTYQFTSDLVGEFFGNFNSPRNEVQGRLPSFTFYNFAFRKLLFNKKGSIGFTTTNPFNKYVNQKTSLAGPNFTLTSIRQIPYRSFGISFSYKFGKIEFKKDKEENRDQNNPGENE